MKAGDRVTYTSYGVPRRGTVVAVESVIWVRPDGYQHVIWLFRESVTVVGE